MNLSNAAVFTTKPGGTSMPARVQFTEAAALAADIESIGKPDVREPADER